MKWPKGSDAGMQARATVSLNSFAGRNFSTAVAVVLLALGALACGDQLPTSDGGLHADAASSSDSGASSDAGPLATDAGTDAGAHADGGPSPDDAGQHMRQVTVCLTGAIKQSDSSNSGFSHLCDALEARDAGVLRDCSQGTCFSSFATFPKTNADAVYPAVFASLDSNRDGTVDALDGPVELNVLGFSWGGVNAAALSAKLASDARIHQHPQLRHRLIVFDAYQPLVSSVTAPATVEAAYSFRHSQVPAGDCSRSAPLGPYKGVRLRCAAQQSCFDFDFSLAANRSFSGILGSDVGHCDVPEASEEFALELLQFGRLSNPPPSVPVTP